MSDDKETFTIIWKIYNFSFRRPSILSPHFITSDGIWRLKLHTRKEKCEDHIFCQLIRIVGTGPDEIELDIELAFLSGNGSVLHSRKFIKKQLGNRVTMKSHVVLSYQKFITRRGNEQDAYRDEEYLTKQKLFVPHEDTFTVRCRMWFSQKSTSPSVRCLAETRIRTETSSAVGTIKKFSCVEEKKTYPVLHPTSCILSDFTLEMDLYVAKDGLLYIAIKLYECNTTYRCKIFILSKFLDKVKVGEKVCRFDEAPLKLSEIFLTRKECGSDGSQDFFIRNKERRFDGTPCIPLTLSKDFLIRNKEYFLPNDELTIHCEIIYGKNGIGELEFLSNFKLEPQIESMTTLKDDLVALFRENVLCDTKLQTATEAFPAHIAVLSARSPVFKAMFLADMKEKKNQSVAIDDLDAETVRRMLSFMYLDTLDDLDYEGAKSLFFAAGKYNIISLKSRCSNYLKQNLVPSNCCNALLLADRHQDVDLKNAVQNYVAENDEEILFSDGWKNLEKNHPHLAIEVFRFLYMKT